MRTLLPTAARKVLALATLLPLLVAVSGADSLCFCGGCARSDALFGVTLDPAGDPAGDPARDAVAVASGAAAHASSPCCKRAAAAAKLLASAQHEDDTRHGRPTAQGCHCCGDHDAMLAPADIAGDPAATAAVSLIGTSAIATPIWFGKARRRAVSVAEARGPPWPPGGLYRSTSRIRI